MMKKIAVLLFCTFFLGSISAKDLVPMMFWNGSLPASFQERPDFLKPTTDPVFKTQFRRMTNDGDHVYYALRPVFNATSELFLLNFNHIRRVSDGKVIGNLNAMVGNQRFDNPIWSKVNPNLVYGSMGLRFVALDIKNKQLRVIRDLGEQDGFITNATQENGHSPFYMDNLQSISGQDQFVVLSDVPRGGKQVVVLNLQDGSIHARIDDIFKSGTPYKPFKSNGESNFRMNVGISLTGKYIVMSGLEGDHLFDNQFNYLRKMVKHGHSDFGLDHQGKDVFVSVCPAKYEVLETGQEYDLLGKDTYACGYVNASANYRQPGWAYLSIHADDNDIGANGQKQTHEVVAVRLDPFGRKVRRIVHPNSTGHGLKTSAMAVPDPTGTLVAFNSTWNDEGGIEGYIAELRTARN